MSRDYSICIQRLNGGGVQSSVYDSQAGEVGRFRVQKTWKAAKALAHDWIKRQRHNDEILDAVISGLRSDLCLQGATR